MAIKNLRAKRDAKAPEPEQAAEGAAKPSDLVKAVVMRDCRMWNRGVGLTPIKGITRQHSVVELTPERFAELEAMGSVVPYAEKAAPEKGGE